MEWLLSQIANAALAYGSSAERAIAAGEIGSQIALLGLALGLGLSALAGTRAIGRWFSRHDEKLHEKLRAAETELRKAEEVTEAVRARNDELLAYDPDHFLERMDVAQRDSVFAHFTSLPEEWLEPLRPALGRAYRSLAREKLLTAATPLDVEEARQCAWGAVAAIPEEEDHQAQLDEVAEAEEALNLHGMTEEERAAFELARMEQDPRSLSRAAAVLLNRGKYRVAHLFAERASARSYLSEGPEGPRRLDAEHWRGVSLNHLGHCERGLATLSEVLEIRRRPDVLGEEHPTTLVTRFERADALEGLGRYDEAVEELGAVLAIERRPDVRGEKHPNTLNTRGEYASALLRLGRLDKAEAELDAVVETMSRPDVLGEEAHGTLVARSKRGDVINQLGRHAEALAEFSATMQIMGRPDVLGEEHPHTLATRVKRAAVLDLLCRHAEALAEFDVTVQIMGRPNVLGEEHPQTLATRHARAIALQRLGRHREAEKELDEVLAIERRTDVLGERHPDVTMTRAHRAVALDGLGRHAEAEAELRAARKRIVKWVEAGALRQDDCRFRFYLARALDHQGKHDEAGLLLDGLSAELANNTGEQHAWVREIEEYTAMRVTSKDGRAVNSNRAQGPELIEPSSDGSGTG